MTENTTTTAQNTYGITASEFCTPEAQRATVLCSLYEGKQEQRVVQMLDGKINGYYARTDWQKRGLVPRVRNVVKMIVDKSANVFNKAPKLAVYVPGTSAPIVDEKLLSILESSDYHEFFQNLDVYTRLLKTTIVLQQKYIANDTTTVGGQYRFDNSTGDALALHLLHRGNCVVRMNKPRTQIIALAYMTSPLKITSGGAQVWTYRLITQDTIIDFMVSGWGDTSKEEVASIEPNVDGIVPATFFYDVNKPRIGYWVEPPEDILSLQDSYNSFLTDFTYATG